MPDSALAEEYAFLKMRFKLSDSGTSALIARLVSRTDELPEAGTIAQETRFSAAVAASGQLLRGGRYTGDFDYDDVIALAMGARGEDHFGYRDEFINLVRLAKSAAAMAELRRE